MRAPLVAALVFAACTGDVIAPTARQVPVPPGEPETQLPPVAPASELRRLSRIELAFALDDALSVSPPELFSLLPPDEGPYDNDYTLQRASDVWLEGMESVAALVAERALTGAARARVMTCTATKSDDAVCFEQVVSRVGRALYRRPLEAAELAGLMRFTALSASTGRFDDAVKAALRVMLQSPDFIFRVETGEVTAQGTRLDAFAFATRLSFFLWGRPPPPWLLDAAQSGALEDPAQVRDAVRRLLDSPLARQHFERFSSQWLGYSALPFDAAKSAAMQAETSALLQRAVFGRRNFLTVFTAPDTLAAPTLREHYGLTSPADPAGWVPYTGTARAGLLSHGAILAKGSRQTETSPTLRGKWLRERLLCDDVPPPPPNVAADAPPVSETGSRCKPDRYAAHATVGACAGCHRKMDPIGFGLERYDAEGRYRTVETNAPECQISGEGMLDGVGAFNGPAQLGALLASSGRVQGCLTRQLFRFGAGRKERPEDLPLLASLTTALEDSGVDVLALLEAQATDPLFRFKTFVP